MHCRLRIPKMCSPQLDACHWVGSVGFLGARLPFPGSEMPFRSPSSISKIWASFSPELQYDMCGSRKVQLSWGSQVCTLGLPARPGHSLLLSLKDPVVVGWIPLGVVVGSEGSLELGGESRCWQRVFLSLSSKQKLLPYLKWPSQSVPYPPPSSLPPSLFPSLPSFSLPFSSPVPHRVVSQRRSCNVSQQGALMYQPRMNVRLFFISTGVSALQKGEVRGVSAWFLPAGVCTSKGIREQGCLPVLSGSKVVCL